MASTAIPSPGSPVLRSRGCRPTWGGAISTRIGGPPQWLTHRPECCTTGSPVSGASSSHPPLISFARTLAMATRWARCAIRLVAMVPPASLDARPLASSARRFAHPLDALTRPHTSRTLSLTSRLAKRHATMSSWLTRSPSWQGCRRRLRPSGTEPCSHTSAPPPEELICPSYCIATLGPSLPESLCGIPVESTITAQHPLWHCDRNRYTPYSNAGEVQRLQQVHRDFLSEYGLTELSGPPLLTLDLTSRGGTHPFRLASLPSLLNTSQADARQQVNCKSWCNKWTVRSWKLQAPIPRASLTY